MTKNTIIVMICPPNRGFPKHLVEAEAKSYTLGSRYTGPQLSPQVDTNILAFSKSKYHLFVTTVLSDGDLTMEGLCHKRKVPLYQLDPQNNKGREEGT